MKQDQTGDSPLKPKHQLASIVFSDTGKVSQNVEDLPRSQKARELSIARKFVQSLHHFLSIEISEVEADEGQADFVGCLESGESILIQVARVVDQQMRRIKQQRESYAQSIIAEHPELIRRFSGCIVSIVGISSGPLLPRVNSSQGMTALTEIVEKLDELADDIDSLEVGKIRSRKYRIGPNNVEISVLCERRAPTERDVPAHIGWTGGYVPDTEYTRMLLAEAIRAKIDMGYSVASNDCF